MERRRSGWERFYRVVARIPPGMVATYGQIAALAGDPRLARHVGFALAALKEGETATDLPWQRVLGSRGPGFAGISLRDPVGESIQRHKLQAEGIEFDTRGRVALDRFGWSGPARRRRAGGGSGLRRRRP